MLSAFKNVGKFVGLSSSQAEPDNDVRGGSIPDSSAHIASDEQESPVMRKSKSKKSKAVDENSTLSAGDEVDVMANIDAEPEQDAKSNKRRKRVAAENKISDTEFRSPEAEAEAETEVVHESLAKKSKRSKKSKVDTEDLEISNGEQDVQEDAEPVKASKKSKKSKRTSLEGDVNGHVDAEVEAEAKPKKKQARAKKITKHIEEDASDEVVETTLVERDAEEISELINSQLTSYKKARKSKSAKDTEGQTESNKAAKTQDYFEADHANNSLVPPPEPLGSSAERRNSTGSSQNDILAASQLYSTQSPVNESPPPTAASQKSAASKKRKEKVNKVVEEPKKAKRSKKAKSQPEVDNLEVEPMEAGAVSKSPSQEPHHDTEDHEVTGSPDLDHVPHSPESSPGPTKSRRTSSWAAINVPSSLAPPAKEPSIYRATPKPAKKRSIPVDIAELPGSTQPKKRTKPSVTKSKMSTTANGDEPKPAKEPKSTTRSRSEGCTAKGKVTPVEEKLIKEAIEKFRDMNNMTDYEVNELIKQNGQHGKPHELWEWVNEDLPSRERLSIIRYARRKFHNYPKRGGWNEDEDEELRQTHAKVGNNWKKISEIIQRHPEDVRDRWRNYLICEDKMKSNNWEDSEETELREAVKKFFDKELKHRQEQNDLGHDLSLDLNESDIQWPKISEYMGHKRSRLQCSAKWKQLREREAPAPRLMQEVLPLPTNTWRQRKAAEAYGKMRTGDKYILASSIKDSRAGRESKIPWNKIGDAEYREKFSAMIMKVAWTKLKNRVEGHDKMPLQKVAEKVLDTFKKYDAKQLEETYDGSTQSPKRKYSMPRKKDNTASNVKRKIVSADTVQDDDEDEDEEQEVDHDAEAEAEARAKAERKKARLEKKQKKAAKLRDRMSRNGESQEPASQEQQADEEVPETQDQDQPPTPDVDVTMQDADWSASTSGRRFREKLNRASQEATIARAYEESIDGDEVQTSTPKKLSSPFRYRKKAVARRSEVDNSDS